MRSLGTYLGVDAQPCSGIAHSLETNASAEDYRRELWLPWWYSIVQRGTEGGRVTDAVEKGPLPGKAFACCLHFFLPFRSFGKAGCVKLVPVLLHLRFSR